VHRAKLAHRLCLPLQGNTGDRVFGLEVLVRQDLVHPSNGRPGPANHIEPSELTSGDRQSPGSATPLGGLDPIKDRAIQRPDRRMKQLASDLEIKTRARPHCHARSAPPHRSTFRPTDPASS